MKSALVILGVAIFVATGCRGQTENTAARTTERPSVNDGRKPSEKQMLTEREVRHAITPAPAFPGYLMRSRRLLKGALGNFHSGGACSACASIEVVVYPNELFARTMYRGLLDDPSFLKGSVWGYGSLYVMQHGNILLLAQGGGYAFEQTLAAAKALQVTGPVAQSQCAVTSVKGEPDGPHVRRVVTCGKAHSMLPAVDR